MPKSKLHHIFIAGLITLGGSLLSYAFLGRPTLIGIDDANITQVYAINLARGLGYVFTPGYERVEGSTSLLWTLINAASFFVTENSEIIILTICFFLTCGSIYIILRFFDILCDRYKYSGYLRLSVQISLVVMLGFYAWSVLSLMDFSLWTFLLYNMVLIILLRINSGINKNKSRFSIIIIVILMGLTRPESMAIVPALILIGIIGEWKITACYKEVINIYAPGLFFSY